MASKEKSREHKEAVLGAIRDHLQRREQPCTKAHVREHVWAEIRNDTAKFGVAYKLNAQASDPELGLKAWDKHIKEFAVSSGLCVQNMHVGNPNAQQHAHQSTLRSDVLWWGEKTRNIVRALHVDANGTEIEVEVFPLSTQASASSQDDTPTDEELAMCAAVLQRLKPSQLDDARIAEVSAAGKALFGRVILKERMGEKDAVDYLKELHNHVGLLKKLEKLQKEVKKAHEERVEAALTCGINQHRERSMLQIASVSAASGSHLLADSARGEGGAITAGTDAEPQPEPQNGHGNASEQGATAVAAAANKLAGGGVEVASVVSAVEYEGHVIETREERRLRVAARAFEEGKRSSDAGGDEAGAGSGGDGGGDLGDLAAAAAAAAQIPRGDFRRHCNMCKKAYQTLHWFYHQLCPACGDFNALKREQSADLTGYVCVVTGGRVRIGYETALKLLRAGATVLVTSRYPHDAAVRFAKEADFAAWGARLEVFGPLELADVPAIEAFCAGIALRWPRIHVLINNAAQTLTRPAGWSQRMAQLEQAAAEELQAMPDAACSPRRLLVTDEFERLHPLHRTPALVPPTLASEEGRGERSEEVAAAEAAATALFEAELHRNETRMAEHEPQRGADPGADGTQHAKSARNAEEGRGVEEGRGTEEKRGAEEEGRGVQVQEEERGAEERASERGGEGGGGGGGGGGALASSSGSSSGACVSVAGGGGVCSGDLVAFPASARTGLPVLDESRQPLDLSLDNSWRRRLGGVSTGEMLHTMAANAVAPFVLCSRLLPLLAPRDDEEEGVWGHIINVSALEGKFNVGKKNGGHPHTNMAKAALNMLTCTSAADYARQRVLMNAVDTGWVTDNAPGGLGPRAKLHSTHVAPPLDEIDGAARVLDPIFLHVNAGWKRHGLFWKNYQVTQW